MMSMLNSVFLMVSVAAVGCGRTPAPSTVQDNEEVTTYDGKVSACADGDTCNITLDNDGTTLKVRFIGIDAPESRGGDDGKGQPFGKEAKVHLNGLIKGKSVRVRALAHDLYERTLGEVYLGNTLVNLEMLKQGLAEAYIWSDDAINAVKYRSAEAKAKTAEKGVWSLDDYERPEDFRRRNREEAE